MVAMPVRVTQTNEHKGDSRCPPSLRAARTSTKTKAVYHLGRAPGPEGLARKGTPPGAGS